MKASSAFGKAVDYLTVKHGRLYDRKAWCPSQNRANEWLEVDLGAIYHVCGVATQGKEHRTDEWTTKFKLGFSVYNTTTKIYKVGGIEKVCDSENFSLLVKTTTPLLLPSYLSGAFLGRCKHISKI